MVASRGRFASSYRNVALYAIVLARSLLDAWSGYEETGTDARQIQVVVDRHDRIRISRCLGEDLLDRL